MENKINIAELLKDCPKGMELDCTMYEDVCFDYVDELNIIHCYMQHETYKTSITFNQHGTPNSDIKSKCVIFPKGKTTWERFVPPIQFKDGDVVSTKNGYFIGIIKVKNNMQVGAYCAINDIGTLAINVFYGFERLATEEEKQKLFDAIKANGYKWNEETKTLEKLPKFKAGNRIKYINGKNKDGVEQGVILSLTNDTYDVAVTNDMSIFIPISEQDDWELVPNKFDINTLKVFDKVLVRDSNEGMWSVSIFSHTWKNKYICIGIWYNQCIPYEGNEHLLGTTNDCDEYYKTW